MMAELGNELLSYLGEPIEAPRVQQLLQELGVNEIPQRKPGRTQINVLAPTHGLEFTFQPASELRDGGSLADSPERLILSVIFFRADYSDTVSAYSRRLPHELQFTNTRAQARAARRAFRIERPLQERSLAVRLALADDRFCRGRAKHQAGDGLAALEAARSTWVEAELALIRDDTQNQFARFASNWRRCAFYSEL